MKSDASSLIASSTPSRRITGCWSNSFPHEIICFISELAMFPPEARCAVSIIERVNDLTPYPKTRRLVISLDERDSSRPVSEEYLPMSSMNFSSTSAKKVSLCHNVSSASIPTSSISVICFLRLTSRYLFSKSPVSLLAYPFRPE